ncbi:DUF6412 domain-containing protein [Luteipulveratus flavus]|uniref:DUF6412 domain-containing protein n=1 Tax=Luteipulveratus flavus TaxID=3031728 RepID=A0ABT6C9E7_9MICO|nr:DUF6412 domain-containing protein [Luteipulveratus sp. YIM 133296]MDF8265534.1 DUF6412 domain-containing protein [Luteipulveratus sp. YIM 133296]
MQLLSDLDTALAVALLLPVAHIVLGTSIAVAATAIVLLLAAVALTVVAPTTTRSVHVDRRRRAWRSLLVALRRPDLPGRPRPRAPGVGPAGA